MDIHAQAESLANALTALPFDDARRLATEGTGLDGLPWLLAVIQTLNVEPKAYRADKANFRR